MPAIRIIFVAFLLTYSVLAVVDLTAAYPLDNGLGSTPPSSPPRSPGGHLVNVTFPIPPDANHDSRDSGISLWDRVLTYFSNDEILNARWGFLRLFMPAGIALPITALFLILWRRRTCTSEE